MRRGGSILYQKLLPRRPGVYCCSFLLSIPPQLAARSFVSFHGPNISPRGPRQRHNHAANKLLTDITERPPDPKSLLTPDELLERAETVCELSFKSKCIRCHFSSSHFFMIRVMNQLMRWWENKRSVLCWTGAGLSTESGIPDYRGFDGSYRRGHQPMVHDQFMQSPRQRQRYWGRGMVGWRQFAHSKPNVSW